MNRKRLFTTSIAKRVLSAFTGLLLCLFLVAHLAGNLSLFSGRGEAFNAYANFLNGVAFNGRHIILLFEISLLALFLLHAYTGLRVWQENKRARPTDYAERRWTRNAKNLEGPHKSRKSWGSTTMGITGTLTLLFVILHVWHFKFGRYIPLKEGAPVAALTATRVLAANAVSSEKPGTQIEAEAKGENRDLAALVIEEFQKPLIVALYVAALLLLGLHLYHGFSSAFQSMGVTGLGKSLVWAGRIFTFVIIGGFLAIPLWIYFLRPR